MPSRGVDRIRGAYSHPKPLWDRGARLDEYGVNAIFVHSGGINDELIARAWGEGCRVFAEFATLNGGYHDWVQKHPEAHPIDDSGAPAPKATWFMGVCPTERAFRQARMAALRELLARYEIGLGEVGFALRMRRDQDLRAAVEDWLEARAERPVEVPASDWLRWEQDKHEKLLAVAAQLP
jgi:hypothetical protein